MPSSNAPEPTADDDADVTPASTKPATGKAASTKASSAAVKQTRARAKSSKDGVKVAKPRSGNPAWLVPLMLVLLIGGLLWVVVYYLTSGSWHWPAGNWNIAFGFVLILAGGVLSTRYK